MLVSYAVSLSINYRIAYKLSIVNEMNNPAVALCILIILKPYDHIIKAEKFNNVQ